MKSAYCHHEWKADLRTTAGRKYGVIQLPACPKCGAKNPKHPDNQPPTPTPHTP